jgi:hypothetical protein
MVGLKVSWRMAWNMPASSGGKGEMARLASGIFKVEKF